MAPQKKSVRVRSNRICFTLNNPSTIEREDILNRLKSLDSSPSAINYAVVGQEVGASGTPHLQGFIHLKTSFLLARDGNISKWRSLIPALARAHLEPAFGSDQDSEKYCLKDNNPLIVIGTPVLNAGSSWDRLLDCKTLEEMREVDPEFVARSHFQAVAICQRNSRYGTFPTPPVQLMEWQYDVVRALLSQNRRQITFVCDEQGNMGKSVLAHFIAGTLKEKVFYCRGGKSSDIVHAFSKGNFEIAIFDYARNKQPEYFAWDLFEEMKDGGVTSLKYDGNCFWLKNPIKVLVLTNHNLSDQRHRLTADRWNTFVLSERTEKKLSVSNIDAVRLVESFYPPPVQDAAPGCVPHVFTPDPVEENLEVEEVRLQEIEEMFKELNENGLLFSDF